MTQNSENPLTRGHKKGFTLIEVVASMALLAVLLTLTSLAWSNAFRRIQKSRHIKQAAILLEEKMTELEALYKMDAALPIPEKEEGGFPENEHFTWQYETRPFTLPDAAVLLKLQQLPQNDMNTKITQILRDILSESITELKLTVILKEQTKYSLSSYFINYGEAPSKVLSALTQILPTGGLPPSEEN